MRPARPSLALRLFVSNASLIAGLSFPNPSHAQILRENFWAPNGTVISMAVSGNTLYFGGGFTQIGPVTGAGVVVDAATGAAVQA